MDPSISIFGDWGTSRLRLYLRQGKTVLDRRDGPGVSALSTSPEQTFLGLVGDWREARPSGAILCGMVGSRIGWIEAPYAPCPATARDLSERVLRIEADGLPVSIIPGLSCVNPLGGPDVMRGEETQILGALELDPGLKRGRHLLVLPGTHSKWAVVEDGAITGFLTAPVGELFALLRQHSTLADDVAADVQGSSAGFAMGLARIAEKGPALLPHLLFETRARQLLDALPSADALGFLSGLLIGADVAAARQWFGELDQVTLVGAPALNGFYGQAIAAQGGGTVAIDGDIAVLAGLSALSPQKNSEFNVLA
jgi:2-dehydro-3-deoxygalactonokinase